MKNYSLYSLITLLALSGCSTISQNDVFSGLKEDTHKNIAWIKTPEEAAMVTKNVNDLLAQPLSQENAVHIALINNRSLQQMYEQIGLSQSELVQAGLMSNPLLGYTIGRGGGVTRSTLSLDVALLDLLWIPLRKNLASVALEETRLTVGDEVLQTVREVKKAYIDAHVIQEKMALYVNLLKSHEASTQLAIRQYAAGNLSKRNLLKMQDTYAHARLEVLDLNRENAMVREKLNHVLGLYGDQTSYILEDVPLKLGASIPNDKELETRAISNRLDLKAATKAVDYAARDAGYTQNTRFLSGMELSAESEKETASQRFNSFGIKIPIPIFDFGQGRMGKAQAMYNQKVHRLYEVAVNIRSQVRESYAASRYAYDKALETTEVIILVNQQILEETKLFYNGMLDGIYELLEDQRRYSEAKMQSVILVGEYNKAQADLEYVLGGANNGTK